MKCPTCSVELRIAERNGVEIDYCPECRGVWLDRGELDKIIDRASGEDSREYAEPYRRESHSDYDRSGHHRKKRKGFLGELFDFDGAPILFR